VTRTLLRGRTLSFSRYPDSVDDSSAYRYEADSGVLIEDGKIIAIGEYASVAKKAEGAKVIDHRPNLILPGFIDCHAHYPQMQIIASYGAELLDWLNTYTFPEETKFVDTQHGRRIARIFPGRTDPPRHDQRGCLLLGTQIQRRSVLRRVAFTRHAQHRRQGDDGPQRAAGGARHAAIRL
jgi:hypothetical protein